METDFVKAAPRIDLDGQAAPADSGAKAGLVGIVAAGIAGSLCCLGPLVLVSVGISGAWISNLTLLEPYRWIFVLAALGFMAYAWKRIYRAPPAAECEPGTLCALPQTNRTYRVIFWIVSVLVVLMLVAPYFAPLFY
ncbi:MAG TPA: mercuric ion transporter MerT [Burkholderiales bacterium]|nr:mercuric ion transporter MerT [Burkholderiales bacterium]